MGGWAAKSPAETVFISLPVNTPMTLRVNQKVVCNFYLM
jgi:hypothetical protein